MHLHLAVEDGGGHALVVHEVARGLPHGRRRQAVGLLVEGQEVDGGLRVSLHPDAVVEPRDLVGGQVLGDVHVALLEEELLRRALGDVAQDHAVEVRPLLEVVLVRLEPHDLGRAEGGHGERAGACGVGVEPGVALIAPFRVGHHRLHVDDGGRTRGEDVHHEGGGELAVVADGDGVALGGDHLAHVLGGSSRAARG